MDPSVADVAVEFAVADGDMAVPGECDDSTEDPVDDMAPFDDDDDADASDDHAALARHSRDVGRTTCTNPRRIIAFTGTGDGRCCREGKRKSGRWEMGDAAVGPGQAAAVGAWARAIFFFHFSFFPPARRPPAVHLPSTVTYLKHSATRSTGTKHWLTADHGRH